MRAELPTLRHARALLRHALTASLLLAPLAAQAPTACDACLRWVADGRNAEGHDAPELRLAHWAADILEHEQADPLVRRLGEIAELPTTTVPTRRRAVEVLIDCAGADFRAGLSDTGKELLARTVVRQVAANDLPASLRGQLLLLMPLMPERPERLDWLLEGQVRIKNVLRVRRTGGRHADEDLLAPILEYYAALERDALPMLPFVAGLLTETTLPNDGLARCITTYGRLARLQEPSAAAAAVCRLQAAREQLPARDSSLLLAMADVVHGCPALLAEPDGTRTFLRLLDELAASLQRAQRLDSASRLAVRLLHEHGHVLDDIRDKQLRATVLKRCDELMQVAATRNVAALQEAAAAWQRQRR